MANNYENNTEKSTGMVKGILPPIQAKGVFYKNYIDKNTVNKIAYFFSNFNVDYFKDQVDFMKQLQNKVQDNNYMPGYVLKHSILDIDLNKF